MIDIQGNKCDVKTKDGKIAILLSDGKQRCEAVFNVTAAYSLKQDIEKAILAIAAGIETE